MGIRDFITAKLIQFAGDYTLTKPGQFVVKSDGNAYVFVGGLETALSTGGGGGGGAPTNAQYLTLATNATLTQERTLSLSAPLAGSDGGAGSAYTVAISGWSGTTDGDMLYRNGSAVGTKTAAQARTWLDIATYYQAADAGLTSLTAADASAGLPYVSGANTWATATYSGMLSVVSGAWKVVGLRESGGTDIGMGAVADGAVLRRSGTSIVGAAIGSVLQAWAAILDAIAALSSTGLIARTGSGTVAARTLVAGPGVTITDGDGVSGNPTISAGSGSFPDPTTRLFYYWRTNKNTINYDGPTTGLTALTDGTTDTYNSTLCTSTGTGSHAGPNCSTMTRLGHNGTMRWRVRTTTVTNKRLKVGYFTGTHTGSPDTPTTGGYYLLFRASSAIPDSNWQIVHGTGTASAYTVTDTGIAWSATTTYDFEITTSSSGVTYTVIKDPDGSPTSYSTTITTNNPAASANIGWTAVCTSTTGTQTMEFFGAYYYADHP